MLSAIFILHGSQSESALYSETSVQRRARFRCIRGSFFLHIPLLGGQENRSFCYTDVPLYSHKHPLQSVQGLDSANFKVHARIMLNDIFLHALIFLVTKKNTYIVIQSILRCKEVI